MNADRDVLVISELPQQVADCAERVPAPYELIDSRVLARMFHMGDVHLTYHFEDLSWPFTERFSSDGRFGVVGGREVVSGVYRIYGSAIWTDASAGIELYEDRWRLVLVDQNSPELFYLMECSGENSIERVSIDVGGVR